MSLARYEGARGSGQLVDPRTNRGVDSFVRFVHDQTRGAVLSKSFPCIGARKAFESGSYLVGAYSELDDRDSAAELGNDLKLFLSLRATTDEEERAEPDKFRRDFSTFVATFAAPIIESEQPFEQLLWRQLQLLHEVDDTPWDPDVSSDPEDPNFGFSFSGNAFFLVGLSPASSRWSRRFPWPTLVFNLHEQFELLRERGIFQRFRDAIRDRDVKLQGNINPVLQDFGESSEARQYSGRHIEPDWRCPFRPQ